jgi:pyrroline-5-carboxylate reductase
MDEETDPTAAFALRLVADLFTALVLQGTLTKERAAALLADSLSAVLASHPEHEQALREIAATVTVQTGMASIDLERKLRSDG